MNQLVAIATGCNIDIDTCDLTWFAFHIRQPGEAAVDTLTSTTIQWIYSYASGKTTVHLPITIAGHLISLISGVGYATNTFQRETILDNSTVTVSRNGQAEDGAYVLIVGTL